MKTSNLIGPALDWAVTKIETGQPYLVAFKYSTDWAQGGPIIEREGIETYRHKALEMWAARCDENVRYGPTPLIAAMRCFVASKLGDDVTIPKELEAQE